MTDWKEIAHALGLELPSDALDRTIAPLESFEPAFRKAAASLTPGIEPATIFDPAPEEHPW